MTANRRTDRGVCPLSFFLKFFDGHWRKPLIPGAARLCKARYWCMADNTAMRHYNDGDGMKLEDAKKMLYAELIEAVLRHARFDPLPKYDSGAPPDIDLYVPFEQEHKTRELIDEAMKRFVGRVFERDEKEHEKKVKF